ncbi:hypothetical protein M758_5G183200 [Ceratodon purpureus]|nr:hypothetical protein M758_5G183200 [Ceratodon purpureus]
MWWPWRNVKRGVVELISRQGKGGVEGRGPNPEAREESAAREMVRMPWIASSCMISKSLGQNTPSNEGTKEPRKEGKTEQSTSTGPRALSAKAGTPRMDGSWGGSVVMGRGRRCHSKRPSPACGGRG